MLKVDDTVLKRELIHCLKSTREPYGLGFNSITRGKHFCCKTQYQVGTREPYGPGFNSITEENTFAVRLSIRWALENLMVLVLFLSQRKTLLL